MRRSDRWISTTLCFLVLMILPVSAFGEEPTQPELFDCGKKICGEWAPKEENTCRTCSIAQCKKQDGGELLVGVKKQTECYEGHGPPPEDSKE